MAEHRQQLITKLTNDLTHSGWSEDEFNNLPERVKAKLEWIPEKQFKNQQGEFLLLEVENEFGIPPWLARTLRTNREELKGTKIFLASVKDVPLDLETAKSAIENSIYLFAGYSEPFPVFDPSSPLSSKAPEASLDAARTRFEGHKRIPLLVTESLQHVANLEYYKELRLFGEQYERQTFESWDQEHNFVSDFLNSNFNRFNRGGLLQGLNVLSLMDEVSEVVAGRRPHFLHSFQTFLLGSIILDDNYTLFNETFRNCFDTRIDNGPDIPWFLASLFHDIACPFESFSKLGQIGNMVHVQVEGLHATYVPHYLANYFRIATLGTIDPAWEPRHDLTEDPLCNVLMQNRDDHGVLGAIGLMAAAENANRRTLNTVVAPAAIAVALHNTRLWPTLIENCQFPVSARRLPLTFLLLVSDNMEEWGRERQRAGNEENCPKALILEINGNSRSFRVWVNNNAAAALLKNRFDWINHKLFSPNDLIINCSLYV